jgi:hypothetical protein
MKNQHFLLPGEYPGDAEDWSVSFVGSGPGWANLGKNDALQPQDSFRWYDKFATLIGAVSGPFSLTNREFLIDDFVLLEKVFVVENADLRQLLPPGSMMQVVTVSGNDSFGGYYMIDRVFMGKSGSEIYVEQDLLHTPPTTAKIVIPPIVYCDVDGYGWPARITDQTTYPIGSGGMGAGETYYVTVDRGVPQTVVFSGGESLLSEILAVFNAQMTGAVAEEVNGQASWYTESKGSQSSLTLVPSGIPSLLLPLGEARGRGQFVQLWEDFFNNMNAATPYEIGNALSVYLQHCSISTRFTSQGGWVRATSEHQGTEAKLQISGPKGTLRSECEWPIAEREQGNNDELEFELNQTHTVMVTLTEGATEADVIAADIKTALTLYDTSVDVVVSGGNIYIDVYDSLECIGGSANVDLLFPEIEPVYGSTAGLDIGFSDRQVQGGDGEHYPTFDDLISILALFGVDGITEQFNWGANFETIEEAGVESGEILNWLTETSIGTIDVVDQGEKRVSLLAFLGDRTFAYRPGSKAIIEGSPGNDDVYTVEQASFEGGVTRVNFAEQLPSGASGGTLKPRTWIVDGDTFEDGWGGGIEEGWRSPRVADGRVFGEPISFPLRIQDNRNILWLGPETTEMKSIQVSGGEYATPAALVSELNAKLVSASISAIFSFGYVDAPNDQYRLTFGLGTSADYDRHSCFFATVSGRQKGKDVRLTLGFADLSPNGTERLIMYPETVFSAINGTPAPGELTDENSFLVDPYSLVVWREVEDPTLVMDHVVDNDGEAGLFNDSEPSVGDSYIEDFIVDGWGGPKINVTLSPDFPDGPPQMSSLALFNTDPGPATTYEDFETGWD